MPAEVVPGKILQVEVVLRRGEYDANTTALGTIATTLAGVRKGVIPIVTSPAYKHDLCESGLDGTARQFEQLLMRESASRLRELMGAVRDSYERSIGLGTDISRANDQETTPISEWILSIATRRSFVESLTALDTEGIQQRIKRLRDKGGWMICILDATDGLLVTNRRTEKMVDTLVEGASGDLLHTQINPLPGDNPDIAVFGKPESLEGFLVHKGIVNADSAHTTGNGKAQESAQSVWDMAELFEIFMSADPPQNKSLADFEQWIYKAGTLRSHYKDYLLAIHQGMKEAANMPTLAEREDAVKEIRASLTDALLQYGLHPDIVKECARVINTHVIHASLHGTSPRYS